MTRVNILCELVEAMHSNEDADARDKLHQLVSLSIKRGYEEGAKIWKIGPGKNDIRALCWNISSLLEDDDFRKLGFKVGKDR